MSLPLVGQSQSRRWFARNALAGVAAQLLCMTASGQEVPVEKKEAALSKEQLREVAKQRSEDQLAVLKERSRLSQELKQAAAAGDAERGQSLTEQLGETARTLEDMKNRADAEVWQSLVERQSRRGFEWHEPKVGKSGKPTAAGWKPKKREAAPVKGKSADQGSP